MGYTHYLSKGPGKPEEAPDLEALKSAILKVLSKHDDILAGPSGEKGTKPTVLSHAVYFNGIDNGVEDDSFESAEVPLTQEGILDFIFCKTGHRPYDKVVVACYAIAGLYFGKGITFSSDGDLEELEKGFEIAAEALGNDVYQNAILLLKDDQTPEMEGFVKYLLKRGGYEKAS